MQWILQCCFAGDVPTFWVGVWNRYQFTNVFWLTLFCIQYIFTIIITRLWPLSEVCISTPAVGAATVHTIIRDQWSSYVQCKAYVYVFHRRVLICECRCTIGLQSGHYIRLPLQTSANKRGCCLYCGGRWCSSGNDVNGGMICCLSVGWKDIEISV